MDERTDTHGPTDGRLNRKKDKQRSDIRANWRKVDLQEGTIIADDNHGDDF